MASLNHVEFIGNLGADPEMRYTQDGKAVANFRLAVNDRQQGRQEREETLWVRCVVFEKTAEAANEYLRKGSPAMVIGRLQVRTYLDRDNVERTAVEVLCNRVIFLGQREAGEGGEARPARAAAPARRQPVAVGVGGALAKPPVATTKPGDPDYLGDPEGQDLDDLPF